MARHGATTPFDATQEDWTTYVECLEMYFLANEVGEAARKRVVLLSVCGPTAYRLIQNLAQPVKPSEVSYDNIVKLLSDHYFPSKSILTQRFRFNSHCRRPSETIADYVAELRRISEHCQFADSLNAMLRDRLVCGINDQRMQRCLYSRNRILHARKLWSWCKQSNLLSKMCGICRSRCREIYMPSHL